MDLRVKQLADVLVNYSCNVQKNEKVLINYEGECCKPLVKQLIKNIYARGGMPYVGFLRNKRNSAGSHRGADGFS